MQNNYYEERWLFCFNCTILVQGWAFAHFEKVRSLFLKSENRAFRKFALFCTFLLICSLWKSDCAIALFFALLKRAIVQVITQLLFPKERLCSQLRFLKRVKKCDVLMPNPALSLFCSLIRAITPFVKKSEKSAIRKFALFCTFTLIRSFRNSYTNIYRNLFFSALERSRLNLLFWQNLNLLHCISNCAI